jgi:hypothetical protein
MTLNGRNLAGSNDIKRDNNDFYPTPEWATQALLDREKFNGTIWECASGDGSMSKIIEKNGYSVYSSDLRNNNIYGEGNIDFLKINKQFDNIITNPPFMLAKEFVEHAKECTTNKIAMFLKLVFLEGISRYDFFKDKKFPLKKVYVFCKRVNLYKGTLDGSGKNSGTIAFAWFVWDKSYIGEPTIDWIMENKNNTLF